MSETRRKTGPKPASAGVPAANEDAAARIVAIPKGEQTGAGQRAAKPKVERIGDMLRNARLERNDDIYEIAEYLCIKPAFLIALENSNYDAFPADAYVIGFLRTYANFLGINGKDAVDLYRYEMAGRRKKPVLAMPEPMSEGRLPSALLVVGAMVVVLLIYALWYSLASGNRADVNTPPPLPTATAAPADAAALAVPVTLPPETKAAPAESAAPAALPPAAPGIVISGGSPAVEEMKGAPEKTPPAKAKTADKPAPAAKDAKDKVAVATGPTKLLPAAGELHVYGDPSAPSRVIVRALQTSWVMITDANGKTVFDQVLKPGDIYKVPDRPGLLLTTGNGAGIALSLDGRPLPKIANGDPHVVRDIPLDPAKIGSQ